MRIAFITTGGTIDKVYFDALSRFEVGETVVAQVLRRGGVGFEFEVVPLMRKDSLELTDTDRAAIRAAVAARDESHIVITHGTDTMVETARWLEDVPGKTMVLAGALSPARFQDSDAVFNLGMAVVSKRMPSRIGVSTCLPWGRSAVASTSSMRESAPRA
jgi:L-asparaginase